MDRVLMCGHWYTNCELSAALWKVARTRILVYCTTAVRMCSASLHGPWSHIGSARHALSRGSRGPWWPALSNPSCMCSSGQKGRALGQHIYLFLRPAALNPHPGARRVHEGPLQVQKMSQITVISPIWEKKKKSKKRNLSGGRVFDPGCSACADRTQNLFEEVSVVSRGCGNR